MTEMFRKNELPGKDTVNFKRTIPIESWSWLSVRSHLTLEVMAQLQTKSAQNLYPLELWIQVPIKHIERRHPPHLRPPISVICARKGPITWAGLPCLTGWLDLPKFFYLGVTWSEIAQNWLARFADITWAARDRNELNFGAKGFALVSRADPVNVHDNKENFEPG